jgi:hypothetical protein
MDISQKTSGADISPCCPAFTVKQACHWSDSHVHLAFVDPTRAWATSVFLLYCMASCMQAILGSGGHWPRQQPGCWLRFTGAAHDIPADIMTVRQHQHGDIAALTCASQTVCMQADKPASGCGKCLEVVCADSDVRDAVQHSCWQSSMRHLISIAFSRLQYP